MATRSARERLEELKAERELAELGGAGGGSRLERILGKPKEFLKRKKRVPYIIGLFFTAIFYIFLILLVGGAILYGVFYIIAYSRAGGAGVVSTQIGIVAEQAWDMVKGAGYPLRQLLRSPTASESFESTVEKNQYNQDLGVKISSLRALDSRVFENQPIIVRGEIKALSLEDMTISVYCTMGDEKVDGQVSAKGGGDTIKIFKEVPQTFSATCTFSGVTLGEGKDIGAKKIEMFAKYNFNSLATHTTYLLSGDNAEFLLSKGEDPFEYYGIDDSLLKSDRTIRSKATQGPVLVSIGTLESQPFSEDIPYTLGVSMKNNLDWSGNLQTIRSLDLIIPQNIVLASDSDFLRKQISGETLFETETACNFVNTGAVDDNGFKIYSLSSSRLKYVNELCEKSSLILFSSEQDCWDYKNNLEFWCKFMVVEDIPSDIPYFTFIRANANYVYETSKAITVKIYKSPGMV